MMMIDQYRAEVRRFYKTERDAGRLSLNLTYPTVARLRNECLMLFNEGCNKSDLRVLTSFLGRPFNVELHESAIRRCDPDKFKALYNFLKRDIKTSEKNFELLAWLINFQPRQYSKYLFEEKKKREITKVQTIAKANPLLSQIFINEKPSTKDVVFCDKLTDIPVSVGIDSRRINHHGISRGEQQNIPMLSREYLERSTQGVYAGQNSELDVKRKEFMRNEEIPEKSLPRSEEVQTQITLEYPSGVKLSVSTSDLGLISRLIRL
ncbi:MAG: hypothetical protein J7577_22975 [Sphingobacteriaceae bacterium]|nr:hypothetical protein [Sphingobacteriaceae bacterium]